jgi:hypothetical protein
MRYVIETDDFSGYRTYFVIDTTTDEVVLRYVSSDKAEAACSELNLPI